MDDQIILRLAAKTLIPFILVFALYVHFHGDYGPGGGFQAGVIFAAGFVLYALVYGLRRTVHVMPPWVPFACGALGVLIYAGVGFLTIGLGAEYLNYNVLAHDPEHGQHYGILLVELGVLVTVFGVMLGVFYAFAGRRSLDG